MSLDSFLLRDLPVPTSLKADAWDQLAGMRIPLPSARQKDLDPHWESLIGEVLQPFGMERREIRLKYPRDTFFSKGDRPALFFPVGVELKTEPDAVYPGRSAITIHFDLPRGAYATLALKCLFAFPTREEIVDEEAWNV